jgi:hypothetical protein
MNESQMMAQAVKTFYGEEGPKNPASAPFPVSRARFADLAANGLVIEVAAIEAPAEAKPVAGDAAESKVGRSARAK